MRKLGIIFASAALIVSLMVAGVSAQDSTPAPQGDAVERDGVSLTIYNQGTALVQDRRTFNLQSGFNTLDFTDVAASIDPTSVTFVSLTDPTGTIVLEQNYVYDLVDSRRCWQRYLDQRIDVIATDGTQYNGQLLSGRNGEIILRQDDGQVIVLGQSNVRDIRFPDCPAD